ncbi:hypothetical protein GCM10019059_43150 [Camelimonas fluminis]|uniref:DUF2924 domain-containing protein n=1 Tax=Camelimonas fluminis TaxID=1576911 RepID=A0ABV7UPA3_9HYPH|nr:DUF2924 domain-containing protein [Camelimonas fluminis]GHE80211.1 hypothetical protein GCM10019059_43150 [Camelimonas fluminis]
MAFPMVPSDEEIGPQGPSCDSCPVDDREAAEVRLELPARLEALGMMDRDALIAEWKRQFRATPPDRIRRDLLELAIAWKLQERALGGLKKTLAAELRNLAEDLAATGDIRRARAPRLKAGARLVREWGGNIHEVTVTETGFIWKGEVWTSLSAIAGEITGARWSGPRFFGLATGSRAAGRSRAHPDAKQEGSGAHA